MGIKTLSGDGDSSSKTMGFFLCNHETCSGYALHSLRTFQLSCFATMPDPKPGPVICFTLVHLFRLRFNLENILAASLPTVPEPWPVICSASVHLFRLSLTLGNIPFTPRFLFHDRFLLSPPDFTTDLRDT